MTGLLVAGIGVLVAGLLAIGFGIQDKEFEVGKTLIIAGAVAAGTGVITLGLWVLVRELKDIAGRLGPARLPIKNEQKSPATAEAKPADPPSGNDGALFSGDRPAQENAGGADSTAQPSSPAPWQDDASARDRSRGRADVPAEPAPHESESAPVAKPRRNLLFSSSSRKERERAQARTTDPSMTESSPATSTERPASAPEADAPVTRFEDAWPQSERSRSDAASRRSGRAPSTFTESNTGTAGADRYPPATPAAEPSPVTVLKSGVVDGMAYSLYSDGSIEAQMPEGMMRFASIDELRSHLDQRP